MMGALLTIIIFCSLLGISQVVFLILQYAELKKLNGILIKDSTQTYLQAIQGQKTKKPILSPTRNGVPIQDNRQIKNDQDSQNEGMNLLEMDPEEGYQAILDTMGVKE